MNCILNVFQGINEIEFSMKDNSKELVQKDSIYIMKNTNNTTSTAGTFLIVL